MSSWSSSVVMFPGAGSFGGELRQLLRELEPPAWIVRYPGRFGKDFGRAAGSFEEVVQSCIAQVRRRESARVVLVGHSFGAYVAYATAGKLEEQALDISALVVVGAIAPSLLSVAESATRDRSDIAAYLDSIEVNLMSDESSSEWTDIVLDAAMQDLRLLRESKVSEYRKVRCPVFAARGEMDPLTSTDAMREWAGATVGGCACRNFPGGHSDLLRSQEFRSWLREARAGGAEVLRQWDETSRRNSLLLPDSEEVTQAKG